MFATRRFRPRFINHQSPITNHQSSFIIHHSSFINHHSSILRAVVVLGALAAPGCRPSEPPQFGLNPEGRDPEEISLMQVDQITGKLEKLFGTPDHPRVPEGVDLSLELLEMAAGPVGRLADDDGRPLQERGLYRQHCAVCHGISGDGIGPLASVLAPYPRDFRYGLFKFTSTASGEKPVRDDLRRALLIGNTDTAMPSFRTLPEDQIEALVEYIKYLSIRGETDLFLLQTVIGGEEYLPLDEVIEDGVLPVVDLWVEAEQNVIEPPDPPPTDTQEQLVASMILGRKLYLSENAKCFQCHGQRGKGDGEQSEDLYDQWNKQKKGTTPEETKKRARRFRLPIQKVRPRDLTRGVFHGGDRPIDIYRRIRAGIKGTPMPSASSALGPPEIWHLVHYVRSLD